MYFKVKFNGCRVYYVDEKRKKNQRWIWRTLRNMRRIWFKVSIS